MFLRNVLGKFFHELLTGYEKPFGEMDNRWSRSEGVWPAVDQRAKLWGRDNVNFTTGHICSLNGDVRVPLAASKRNQLISVCEWNDRLTQSSRSSKIHNEARRIHAQARGFERESERAHEDHSCTLRLVAKRLRIPCISRGGSTHNRNRGTCTVYS